MITSQLIKMHERIIITHKTLPHQYNLGWLSLCIYDINHKQLNIYYIILLLKYKVGPYKVL